MSDNSATSFFFQNLNPRIIRVLQASLTLFTEQGFFKTSVHDIARDAEVSIGFIYHHFKDKEGIARELYHILLNRMNAALDEIEQQQLENTARCYAVIQLLFKLTETEATAMEFIIHARHREFLPSEKSICSTTAFVRMRSFVYAAIEQGEIKPMDPLVAAMIVYGGAIRMVCLRLDGVIETPLEQLQDALWENTWKGLDP